MHLRTWIVLALLLPACEEKPAGRKLASGIAQRLTVSGRRVAFLLDAHRPEDRSVPDDLLAGDLHWADLDRPVASSKVGSGVATVPGSFAFSSDDQQLAFLAGWRFREGKGELWVATAVGNNRVAEDVSAFAWSPVGTDLALVAPDKLGLLRPGGVSSVPLEGLHDVAWAPDGKRLAARAAAAAGGRLWLVDRTSLATKEVAKGTSDFAFAADGTLAVLGPAPAKGGDRPLTVHEEGFVERPVGRATSFAFSPDGKELALLSTARQPGEATGELFRISRTGGPAQPIGRRVADWRWAGPGQLVFLARYDPRARAGALTVSTRGSPPREVAPKAQSFVVDGGRLFWLVPVAQKGDFKIELWQTKLEGGEPRRIEAGVYGWQVSPDGKTLFYKALCAGGPRSCSLFRAPLEGGAVQRMAPDVAGFDLSRDGSRILLQEPHRGAPRAVDLDAILAGGDPPREVKPFAIEVDPSSRFADAAGKEAVVAIVGAGKGGVSVVPVP